MPTLVVPLASAFSVVALAVGATPAGAATALVVTASDSGPGSFRAAVAAASANPEIDRIVFAGGLAAIELQSAVHYTGRQSLAIVANGAVLRGSGLIATTHGDLTVIGLTIVDAPQDGLTYEVPPDATGTKRVLLHEVTVRRSGGHGVLVNDQLFPDRSGDPDTATPPDPAGSSASLDVVVLGSTFDGNGFGALDRDGLRVNEGGAGSLTFVARTTTATGNGADGIELDERGPGSVSFDVVRATITRNGGFDLSSPPETRDLDDGMDIDEWNEGDLIGVVRTSIASDNYEEGWDFNENNLGDFRLDAVNVEASRNREEGLDVEEDDDVGDYPGEPWGGDVAVSLTNVVADDNAGGDAGIKLREKAAGSLLASLRGARACGNDGDGINVREDASGSLAASVWHSTTNENGDDGVHLDENAAGDLLASAAHGTSSRNEDDGLVGDEGGAGGGTLEVAFVTFADNGGDDLVVVGDVVLTQKP